MVLVKDGVSESGTIRDTEEGEAEEAAGQNTILRLDKMEVSMVLKAVNPSVISVTVTESFSLFVSNLL